MYSGAQISLYPMAGDFVGIILGALTALDPYRERLQVDTDDLSTLLVGAPEVVFPAMRDLFVAAARSGEHCVLHATLSRGCPGEPDDAICHTTQYGGPHEPLEQRKTAALDAVGTAPVTAMQAAAQFSLYVMGTDDHMDEIYGCIDFLKQSGVFGRAKNFCTRLDGDAGAVFAAIEAALCRFGPPQGHVTIDLTVSANSPTPR
ncbi:YkoF family thiamine/hydroxymethylpyrimidine-binding protein [Devosia sp.]|uniref:YkoF family thiamine/hydroxymethylpyrimidine-binding protein n=1 Tax=Devosia sp. TaxID=1871048 RepID=UPI0019EECD43|nr:YkoF family thiamine/hydroxymethylpyrimidine-binding protein [Devosia sp.]MBE0580849.1 HMP/thiamine-binding protein [Devosia sp.]